MSEPSAKPGEPRFCSACGGALPGPVKHCPQCGAPVQARRGLGPLAIIALVFVMGGTCLVGLMVAIAIPGFLKHQIRTREVDVKIQLRGLLDAEVAAFNRDGSFVELGPLPAQQPGPTKTPLSAAEHQVAAGLGWAVGPSTYGQFRVVVARDASGAQAASLCAETDLDGDGTRGVQVAFLPEQREDGSPAAAPPPAPCTTPVPWDGRWAPGEIVKVEALDF